MKTPLILRASLLAAAFGASLSAQASFEYRFVGADQSAPFLASFTLTTSTLITSSTTVKAADFDAYQLSPLFYNDRLVSIDLLPSSRAGGSSITPPMDVVVLHSASPGSLSSGSNYWYFAAGTFASLGNHDTVIRPGSISVTPVPEPASMAALGLGALGLLRRRRRA